jgi:D-sedoheptulose 7-phosphate isomerase
MQQYILQSLQESEQTLKRVLEDSQTLSLVSQATATFVKSLEQGGKILSCGNGGSYCDAMHFAEELTGRYRKDRRPLAAISLGDPGHMTCVSNDFGYKYIFSRLTEAYGKKGDTLLVISTSGQSENCIEAVKVAKAQGLSTVGLLGKDGGILKSLVDVPIIVPSSVTDRIQEIHIKLIHIFIEGIERSFFPDHYSR